MISIKKLILTFSFLFTSFLFAWQPSGWVYQLGNYHYDFQSGEWYYTDTSWDFWYIGMSEQGWTREPTNGWNYYSWPYFWSDSLGEWCYASPDPGPAAYVVSLTTGQWSIFGYGVDTSYAPSSIVEGTVIEETMGYDSYSSGDTVSFALGNNEYIEFNKNLNWVYVGSFSYSQTTANSAVVVYTFTSVERDDGVLYVVDTPSTMEDYILFNSESAYSTDYGSTGTVTAPQDVALTSVANYSIILNSYDGEAVTLDMYTESSGTAAFTMEGESPAPFTYTYEKNGLREGNVVVNVADGANTATFGFYYLTPTNGYYYGTVEGTGVDTDSGYDWGTFELQSD